MIVSSLTLLDNPQKDGRRIIIEQFVDDSGNIMQQSCMINKADSVSNHLLASISTLNARSQFLIANAIPIAQAVVAAAQQQVANDQIVLAQAQAALAVASQVQQAGV